MSVSARFPWVFSLCVWAMLASPAWADANPAEADAEHAQWLVYSDGIPDQADALRFVIDACARACQAHTGPANKTDWEQAREPKLKELAAALGLDPMPERTPLNARVTGRAERDWYSIENVVFESRPGLLVTCTVYVPKKVEIPAPAVVVVPGHAMEDGKNYELYATAQLGLVRMGIIVLAYDPIGQGERKLPGFSHEMGYGSLLVGQTNEGMIVWDTLRAADYLASRPDVDSERMGLAGNSGGGENTFYAIPFEPRFKAGASFCFTCSFDAWLREGGNHCICNHMPGLINRMEQFEIIGLNVPRAFLMGNGSEDKIFPIAGTRETYRRARALYGLYGLEERVSAVEVPLDHGWSPGLREAAYGWMGLWLLGQGDGSPIPEGEIVPNDAKSPDVLCFDGAMIPVDSESVVTLNRRLADELRKAYSTPPENAQEWQKRAESLRGELWSVLRGRPADTTPEARMVGEFEWQGRSVEKLALTTEPGMEVACVFIKPENANGPSPVVVCLHEDGKARLADDPVVKAMLGNGCAVLALDTRGQGESAAGITENHIVSDTVCLGRPLFAMRVWDVMQATRYAKGREDVDANRVSCYGQAGGGLLALYAAALGAGFERVAALNPLASYRFFIENDQPQPIWLCVPNILKTADIAQVAALAGPVPMLIAEPVGYGRAPLSAEDARAEFSFTSSACESSSAGRTFRLMSGEPQETRAGVAAFLTGKDM